jgi:hypothetical protein
MNDMLHNKRRKSKGEKRADFKDLHARNDAKTFFSPQMNADERGSGTRVHLRSSAAQKNLLNPLSF